MTTEGWLILASMFFGFVFGYGWANSAKYAAIWEEYYRSKREGKKEDEKGPIICGECKHYDPDGSWALSCMVNPETERSWSAIRGYTYHSVPRDPHELNHDGNCKLFEPKSESVVVNCQICGVEIHTQIDNPLYQEKVKNGLPFYCMVCASSLPKSDDNPLPNDLDSNGVKNA